jgi:hypothetical protein
MCSGYWQRRYGNHSGCGLDGRGSVPSSVQIGSEAHAASLSNGYPSFSQGVKRPGRGADHSPPSPSSAQVKNGGAIPPLPIRLHGLVLNYLKYRDNFTFYL